MLRRIISVLIPVLTFNLAGFTLAFGYGTRLGHPISTVCFFGGLILFITSIVGFIQVVSNNSEQNKTTGNYNFLLNTVGFYVLGILLLAYFLGEGWNEFDNSEGRQTVVAVYLGLAIASIIYSNYSLGSNNNTNYVLAACATNLFGFFGCLYYLTKVEDSNFAQIGVNREIIELTDSTIFIGEQADTTYYKKGNKTIIDKQGLDSIR